MKPRFPNIMDEYHSWIFTKQFKPL